MQHVQSRTDGRTAAVDRRKTGRRSGHARRRWIARVIAAIPMLVALLVPGIAARAQEQPCADAAGQPVAPVA